MIVNSHSKAKETKELKQDDKKIEERITTEPEFKEFPAFAKDFKPISNKYENESYFSDKKDLVVAVDSMPLFEFIHHIFSEILDVNYVLDKQVTESKFPVTLSLKEPVSKKLLFKIVQDILSKNNIIIKIQEDIFYIFESPGKSGMIAGIGSELEDIPNTNGNVKQFIPIKYAQVEDLASFLPRDQNVSIFFMIKENMLIATGNREQIEQVIAMVKILDQPTMRNRFISMYKVKNWDLKEFVNKLGELLKEEGIPVSFEPGMKGVYFNTISRLSAILFFSAEKEWMERAKHWIKIIDIPLEKDEVQFFIYYPKNRKANEIRDVLSNILSTNKEQDKQEKKQISDPVKPVEKNEINIISQITEDIRIVVDENRNCIIFYTTKKKYDSVKLLIDKIDVMPRQVLINATIAEVTLTGSLQYGFEWFLKNMSGSQTSILKTMGGLGLGSGGMDYSIINNSKNFQLLINSLAKEDVIKIISNPRLVALDGKNAVINVGTEVPIITSEAVSPEVQVQGTSNILRSVQYRSTGITLNVTPSIHSESLISMIISQTVSEAQANNTSNISSPIILNRSISTEVIAMEGQAILLGGLIKENISQGQTMVPILSSIPIIGNLFKTKSQGSDRTELVIIITPYIIRNSIDFESIRNAIFESFNYISQQPLD
ncbi:MAG: hypothetical protein HQK76_09940 [Desulfobacterales bacterium]|nr:hypothetical protein [Desulfobacterales bacterium]